MVQGLLGALAALDEPPDIVTWTVSGRDHSDAGVGATPLALPAFIAVPLWKHLDRPRVDRRLGRPDVIHGTNYIVPPSLAPSLVSVYDLSFIHDAGSMSPSVRRFDGFIRSAVGRGAVIHTTSFAVEAELRDRYDAPVEVIYPGIHPGVARSAPTGPPYIAAVGTAVKRKRLPLLIEAFALLAQERADLELRIASASGPDSPAIEAALKRLAPGIATRALHLGRIDDMARDRLVEGAAVLAHPSRYEGFGLPILEAMNIGVPVVVADAGAASEVAGDAALLVAPDDASALASGLAKVLDDSHFAADLARRGVQRSADFEWSTAATRMVELYQRLST